MVVLPLWIDDEGGDFGGSLLGRESPQGAKAGLSGRPQMQLRLGF